MATVASVVIDRLISEALGEDPTARAAVAWTIANRSNIRNKSPEEVVQEDGEWGTPGPAAKKAMKDPAVRREFEKLWLDVIGGKIPDPTKGPNDLVGADFFHTPAVNPDWAEKFDTRGQIGGHIFYSSGKLPQARIVAASAPVPPMDIPTRPEALPVAATPGAFPDESSAAIARLAYETDGSRNLRVVGDLERAIQESVTAVYGPGYTVGIMSGAQGEGSKGMVGTRRHTTGTAADVWVYDPAGKRLAGDALIPIAQHWLANDIGSVGFPARKGQSLHLDLIGGKGPGAIPLGPKEGRVWYYGTPSEKQTKALNASIASGTMPQYKVEPKSVGLYLNPVPIPATRSAALGTQAALDKTAPKVYDPLSSVAAPKAPIPYDPLSSVQAKPSAPLAPPLPRERPIQSDIRYASAIGPQPAARIPQGVMGGTSIAANGPLSHPTLTADLMFGPGSVPQQFQKPAGAPSPMPRLAERMPPSPQPFPSSRIPTPATRTAQVAPVPATMTAGLRGGPQSAVFKPQVPMEDIDFQRPPMIGAAPIPVAPGQAPPPLPPTQWIDPGKPVVPAKDIPITAPTAAMPNMAPTPATRQPVGKVGEYKPTSPIPMPRIQRDGFLPGIDLPGIPGLVQDLSKAIANASGPFSSNLDNALVQAFRGGNFLAPGAATHRGANGYLYAPRQGGGWINVGRSNSPGPLPDTSNWPSITGIASNGGITYRGSSGGTLNSSTQGSEAWLRATGQL